MVYKVLLRKLYISPDRRNPHRIFQTIKLNNNNKKKNNHFLKGLIKDISQNYINTNLI